MTELSPGVLAFVVTKHETLLQSTTKTIESIKGSKSIWTINCTDEYRSNPHRSVIGERGLVCDFETHNIIVVEALGI